MPRSTIYGRAVCPLVAYGTREKSVSAKSLGFLFKEYDEQMGKTGGDEWRIYGGHRLWIAPEHWYLHKAEVGKDEGSIDKEINPLLGEN